MSSVPSSDFPFLPPDEGSGDTGGASASQSSFAGHTSYQECPRCGQTWPQSHYPIKDGATGQRWLWCMECRLVAWILDLTPL